MIFSHTLQHVLCGTKRQTRRIVKPNESFDNVKQAIVKANTRILYKVGKSYAVQPNRGKKAVARIFITNIRKEKVGAISEADAINEGFASKEDFIAAWQRIHGQDADLETEVWVIEFKLHSIVAEELKVLGYEYSAQNQSVDLSENLSSAIKEVSRGSLHGRNHRERRVGETLSDRLSLLAQ